MLGFKQIHFSKRGPWAIPYILMLPSTLPGHQQTQCWQYMVPKFLCDSGWISTACIEKNLQLFRKQNVFIFRENITMRNDRYFSKCELKHVFLEMNIVIKYYIRMCLINNSNVWALYLPQAFSSCTGNWCYLFLLFPAPATHMITSWNGNIFRVAGPLWGEFTGHRWIPSQMPVTQSFDVCFDMRLNKRLSKQPRRWWLKTPLRPLWRHCIEITLVSHTCSPVFFGSNPIWQLHSLWDESQNVSLLRNDFCHLCYLLLISIETKFGMFYWKSINQNFVTFKGWSR